MKNTATPHTAANNQTAVTDGIWDERGCSTLAFIRKRVWGEATHPAVSEISTVVYRSHVSRFSQVFKSSAESALVIARCVQGCNGSAPMTEVSDIPHPAQSLRFC